MENTAAAKDALIEKETAKSVIMRFEQEYKTDVESEERQKQVYDKMVEQEKARIQKQKEKEVAAEEEKDPEEDFKRIDAYFKKSIEDITAKLYLWTSINSASKELIEKHFD